MTPLSPHATRVPTTNGDEFSFLRARQPPVVVRQGERKAAKRSYARRFRRLMRLALRRGEEG